VKSSKFGNFIVNVIILNFLFTRSSAIYLKNQTFGITVKISIFEIFNKSDISFTFWLLFKKTTISDIFLQNFAKKIIFLGKSSKTRKISKKIPKNIQAINLSVYKLKKYTNI